jgi:hypothetical protein
LSADIPVSQPLQPIGRRVIAGLLETALAGQEKAVAKAEWDRDRGGDQEDRPLPIPDEVTAADPPAARRPARLDLRERQSSPLP